MTDARILLVDDNDKLRALYRISLQMAQGLEVVGEAANGAEAIEETRGKRPDLVLLDLSMPTMDGLEALGRLRQASPQSHVVVLTGFRNERLGSVAIELGATAFLEKGISPTELAARVKDVLARPVPAYHEPGEEKRAELERRVRDLV